MPFHANAQVVWNLPFGTIKATVWSTAVMSSIFPSDVSQKTLRPSDGLFPFRRVARMTTPKRQECDTISPHPASYGFLDSTVLDANREVSKQGGSMTFPESRHLWPKSVTHTGESCRPPQRRLHEQASPHSFPAASQRDVTVAQPGGGKALYVGYTWVFRNIRLKSALRG
jgi:hypothetical protein